MHIKQVRNATMIVEFGSTRFLIDPYLAEFEAYPGFEGTLNSHLRNPRVPLTTPMDEICNVDAIIVTHTHDDHWDAAAQRLLPKDIPLFVQDAKDGALIKDQGFNDVRIMEENTVFGAVTLHKTPGQHGSDAAYEMIGELLGSVCGVVFSHPNEKTVYLAGDTIWNAHVSTNLSKYTPDIVILNAGDAQIPGVGSIIMGTEDVHKVHEFAPQATLIASHMEAVNHGALSRDALAAFAKEKGFAAQLRVPADNETMTF